MAKILLAWEYGGGFGHVAMLVPLALKLREAGHEPVLILRDSKTAASLWKDTGLEVLQAPYLPLPATWDKTIRTDTLADVFALGGLISTSKLTALAQAWQKFLVSLKPDLVICEFSPTLAMATLGVIPTVTVGTGFSMPPTGRALPSIRFWDPALSERSIEHEKQLYQVVCETRQALGLEPLSFVADLFGGEARFICVLPELDCYKAYRQEKPIGPLTSTPLPSFQLQEKASKQAFAYLAGEDGNINRIAQVIAQSGVQCDAYIRSLSRDTLPPDSSLFLHDAPQPLTELLPKRGLLIHHGGMSTSDIALRLGVPQLVLSRHLEQKATGGLLMWEGVAELVMTNHAPDMERLPTVLRTIMENGKYQQRAWQKAKEIAARPARPAVEIVVEACSSLVRGK